MKKILFTAIMLVGLSAFSKAQVKGVGINTSNPAATLDVVADNATLTMPDGVLVPRMTEDQLAAKNSAYANDGADVTKNQNGALVFVTAVDGATTAKTVNVTTVGFYYYDGPAGVWKSVGGNGGSGTDTSIYAGDGTLTSVRTVNQDNKNLTFTTGTARTIINGTQQNNGAVYVASSNMRIQSTQFVGSSVLSSDYMIVITGAGAPNLPDATANPGRVLMLANQSGGALTWGGTDTKFKPVAQSIMTSGKGYLIVSDGSNWYTMAGY